MTVLLTIGWYERKLQQLLPDAYDIYALRSDHGRGVRLHYKQDDPRPWWQRPFKSDPRERQRENAYLMMRNCMLVEGEEDVLLDLRSHQGDGFSIDSHIRRIWSEDPYDQLTNQGG